MAAWISGGIALKSFRMAVSTSAVLASNGHILGSAMALSACRGLQMRSRIALLTQAILALVTLMLSAFWIMEGSVGYMFAAFGMSLVSAVLSWVLPLVRRLS